MRFPAGTRRLLWHNASHRLARYYERRVTVIEAAFDLTDAIITVRA
ncbi:hypothetical protein J2Z21_000745 [Streptomyces griseochromogenes]|uniref:Transposase n=1 Tax=Streptomyces griseochromogenes TaxID=68214 RepID=A0ABS4LKB7_9ACTN|nr:hypothetical protein [Streptomyces griseochromogenes]